MAYKKTVFSIHGIRTRGEWQKSLNDVLSGKYKTHTFDYGFYLATKLVIKPFRDKVIDWFYNEYMNEINSSDSDIEISNYKRRPSIIAHSFGTYIVVMSMLKYEDIKFDKIILCGSILPQDFDWSEILWRDQVSLVRNEFGKKDFWTSIVGVFVSDAGRSGRDGFDYYSNNIEQQQFSYFKHSDYFSKNHFKNYWIKTIEAKPKNHDLIHGRSLNSVESINSILNETSLIDDEVFGILPHYSDIEPSQDNAIEWVKVNPDIYTFLKNKENNTYTGYINAIPVNDSTYMKIAKGELQDRQINEEHILSFDVANEINIYFMSIAISKMERSLDQGLLKSAFERLIHGFIEKLVYYAIYNKTKVKNIIAVAWTIEGIKLCECFGMEEIGRDLYNNPIYNIDLQEENKLPNHKMKLWFDILLNVYKSIK